MQPFFGYPGGKSRAVKEIVKILDFDSSKYTRIIEPFCGGGAFTLGVVKPGQEHWLNDRDTDLMALWNATLFHTDAFCDAIMAAKIKPGDFYTLREKLRKPRPEVVRSDAVVRRALDKLIVHKISFSNMGEMSGSPVGGRNQTGAWKYDCRWKPDLICKRIRKVAETLSDCCLSSWGYQSVLNYAGPFNFLFIDPPYVDAGTKCYKHSFTADDHVTLAQHVRKLKCDWAITYDYHPLVVELYAPWAEVYDLEFKYFMSSAYRAGDKMKTGKELLICKA